LQGQVLRLPYRWLYDSAGNSISKTGFSRIALTVQGGVYYGISFERFSSSHYYMYIICISLYL